MSNELELHLNVPQIKVQLVQANETYLVCARGFGKSTGISPEWVLHRVKQMPRSSGFILGKTYQQLLSRTLPPMINYWYKMNLVRDVDFVVGKKPPTDWEASPYVAPEEYKNTISFVNGTIIHLLSQDRPGNPNSLSLSWGLVDEAKFINMERFNEDLIPAMRGDRNYFEHLPEYNSLLFMTDQPTAPEGQWIWEKEKEMNELQINLILQIQVLIMEHEQALSETENPATIKYHQQILGRLRKRLHRARMNSIFYLEASAIDNIDVLGADYIRKQKRLLPSDMFNVSILNQRMTKVEQGFYPHVSEQLHTYSHFNDSYLDKHDIGASYSDDCRQDSDLDQTKRLELAFDHGASINCMVVGQRNSTTISFKKDFYVLHPETTADLIVSFNQYYQAYKTKKVCIHYDHTAIAEHGKARNITYLQELQEKLNELGWKVELNYLGRTPSHTDRYLLWSNALRNQPNYPSISFNHAHTETLRYAMYSTSAVAGKGENEIRKDKRPERDSKVPQQKATHLTDAADLLLWGLAKRNKTSSNFLNMPTAIG
jgi:hypothetical protein